MRYKYVKFNDPEAEKMLSELKKLDKRTEGDTVAILIRQEYKRRTVKTSSWTTSQGSEPNPDFIQTERG